MVSLRFCMSYHPLTNLEVDKVDMNWMISWTSGIHESPTLDRALGRSRKDAVVDIVEINAINSPYIVLNKLVRASSKSGS